MKKWTGDTTLSWKLEGKNEETFTDKKADHFKAVTSQELITLGWEFLDVINTGNKVQEQILNQAQNSW